MLVSYEDVVGDDLDPVQYAKKHYDLFVKRIIKPGTAEEIESLITCPICYQCTPNMRIVCRAGHHLCHECLVKIQGSDSADEDDDDYGPVSHQCPVCRGDLISSFGIVGRANGALLDMCADSVCVDCGQDAKRGAHTACPSVKASFNRWNKQLAKKRVEFRNDFHADILKAFKATLAAMFETHGIAISQRNILRRELVGKLLRILDEMPLTVPYSKSSSSIMTKAVTRRDWIEDIKRWKKRNFFY